MAGYASFSFLDHSGEKSNTSFYTGNVTAVSLPALLTQFGQLRSAIGLITDGTLSQEELSVFRSRLSNTLPSASAQRERKWLVTYEDSTEFFDAPVNAIPNEGYRKIFTLEIATADIATRLMANSDEADMTDTGIVTFVSAFEAIARSPYGGAVNVLNLTHVGRNL